MRSLRLQKDSQACRDGRMKPHRRGFVLLLVLALLTFATVILARFAQQSLNAVAQVQRREREIQNRWAAWSIASAGLSRAGRILESAESLNDDSPVPAFWTSVELGGHSFHICVNDLDAAINLNAVAREAGTTAVRRAVTLAIRNVKGQVLKATLRSTRGRDRVVYDSWGQIFGFDAVAGSNMAPDVVATIHESMTCWGSGQLNLQRASDENVRHFGTAIGRVGLYGRVIRERASSERLNIDNIIAEAATAPADSELLERTLRSNSGGYSILVTSDTGGPSLLCILEVGFGNFADRRSVFSF